MYRKYIKRALDIIFSLILIIVLAFPMLVIAIVIRFNSAGPSIFKHQRVGIGGKELFYMYKFRTMYSNAPDNVSTQNMKNHSSYVTSVGAFLRRTSVDELPQLFNILFGKMSFVGPRPALWNEEELLFEREKCGVLDVKPGLTGWAQVNGRDNLTVLEKVRYDQEYSEKVSFAFDFLCLVKTLQCVFNGNGI